MIQHVGRNYVTYINHRYQRSGTLWEGRHKGCIVSQEDYLLECSRYIELNPVRAGMVCSPGDYQWSSYRANALGQPNLILSPHPIYTALGPSRIHREFAYRELFRTVLGPARVQDIHATVQTGTPLGNDRFRAEVESVLQHKVGLARRGPPSKLDKGY